MSTSPSKLEGRRVILGVCGGIAAYKAVELCRRLSDRGAKVSPVLTESATQFVGPLTFSALASEDTRVSLYNSPEPSPHTSLGRAADLIVVVPATARLLAAYASGLCHDLLVSTLLMASCPVVVCPAMHTEMWEHPATQANVVLLRERGVTVIEPEDGALAAGDTGKGRLPEVPALVEACEKAIACAPRGNSDRDLEGRSVVVTAGGTREAIDPVRFIGNRSSGKQGHAIACEAARRGASVTLITTTTFAVQEGVTVWPVVSAADMLAAAIAVTPTADLVIMAAAVADFRPSTVATHKIKKDHGPPVITLEPTTDILAELGMQKPEGQVLVGFAAETDDLRVNAVGKLARKRLDLIVANDVSAPGVGFEHDTNSVTLLDCDGGETQVPLSSKQAVAKAVVDAAVARLGDRPVIATSPREFPHSQERNAPHESQRKGST